MYAGADLTSIQMKGTGRPAGSLRYGKIYPSIAPALVCLPSEPPVLECQEIPPRMLLRHAVCLSGRRWSGQEGRMPFS